MKKLFTTLFTLTLFINTYSQELFSGNWDPVSNSETIYSRNFNILNKDIFITSFLKEGNYNVTKTNTSIIIDNGKFRSLNYLHEQVLEASDKNIKTVIYNPKNNYRVYVNYYLKTKRKILATFTDFKTKKIKGIVTFKRTK